jgi:hypothetical protein
MVALFQIINSCPFGHAQLQPTAKFFIKLKIIDLIENYLFVFLFFEIIT